MNGLAFVPVALNYKARLGTSVRYRWTAVLDELGVPLVADSKEELELKLAARGYRLTGNQRSFGGPLVEYDLEEIR